MARVKIEGMTCQHCVAAVTRSLGRIPGIQNVKVDLGRGEASFENTRGASGEAIRQAVEEAGFKVAA